MSNGDWIGVKERLPDNDVKVLLLFKDFDNHIEDGFISTEDSDDGQWYHYLYDGDAMPKNPTHWMPLPKLPSV